MYNTGNSSYTPLVFLFCSLSLYHLPITIAAQYRSHIWLMHDVIIHLFYFSLSDQPIERTLQTPINLHSINRAVNATLTRLIILPSYAQYVHRADSASSLDRMLQLRPTSAAIARSARPPSRTLPSDQRTSLGTLLQLPNCTPAHCFFPSLQTSHIQLGPTSSPAGIKVTDHIAARR